MVTNLYKAHHVIYKVETIRVNEVNGKTVVTCTTKEYRSKVYRYFNSWMPSGQHGFVKVWNTDLNKMVEVIDRDIIKVID